MNDERKETSVNSRVSDNDASAAGIFYGELCLALLTGDATLKNKAYWLYVTIDIEEIRADSP